MHTPDLITLALNSATTIPSTEAVVPEWVHLLPATSGGTVATQDKRGPYVIGDADRIIALSFAEADRLPIDENHATDLAAPRGEAAPARGWIVAMENRADGIWGKVEWTEAGRALLADRAYRGISPVIVHTKGSRKEVLGIARASLVNTPNLRGLTALNSQQQSQDDETMDFMAKLAEALGLSPEGVTEDMILDALANKPKTDDSDTSLQAALATSEATVAALQSQVSDLGQTITAMQQSNARSAAAAFIDGAIREGRAGINAANRETYIALHMENAQRTETLVKHLPKLSGEIETPTDLPDGEVSLNAADRAVITQLGLSEEDYKTSLQSSRQ